ncbi:DUF6191 domain-containing protein [Streptomyces sp. DSM 41014]|jgi:hypothetical protein|uniref:DUF6191 domain-containing protein n=1 Tax=Streptomyces hintoniae TaxID=3075521 RepID=A0ABU2UWW7_9ACTN|nr:DUF6191 domain-containing protein [Streptomyces sp. DSM 41014]MDT0477798.1 DUF6191 domain-containing protein [Streptomyces sp. DSM 41014]
MLGTGITLTALALFLLVGIWAVRWIGKRRRESSGYAGNFEALEVFHPSQRHVSEEIQRQRLTKQDEGDAAPPLDLDSGRVSFVVRNSADDEKTN